MPINKQTVRKNDTVSNQSLYLLSAHVDAANQFIDGSMDERVESPCKQSRLLLSHLLMCEKAPERIPLTSLNIVKS